MVPTDEVHGSSERPGKAHEGFDVLNAEDRARFEQIVLPHLDAAFNLAVWILSSRTDAEDVTQDVMLRALRFFEGFHGGDVRACLLAANRPQYLLHLVAEESPNEDEGPIR
jgi:hypothetical protein